jgi:hypothetical protein
VAASGVALESHDVLEDGNVATKEGDESPGRLYVIFDFDPGSRGGMRKMKYHLAKMVYRQDPPDSVLNDLWADRSWTREIIPNAHNVTVIMLAPDSGKEHLSRWWAHRVNILEDYRKAFGQEPPAKVSIAVMGRL